MHRSGINIFTNKSAAVAFIDILMAAREGLIAHLSRRLIGELIV